MTLTQLRAYCFVPPGLSPWRGVRGLTSWATLCCPSGTLVDYRRDRNSPLAAAALLLATLLLIPFTASADVAIVYNDATGHHITWPEDVERATIDIPQPDAIGHDGGSLAIASGGDIFVFDEFTGDRTAQTKLPYKPLATERGLPVLALHEPTGTITYLTKRRGKLQLATVSLDTGKANSRPLPDTLDNAAIAQWEGGVYILSHVRNEEGECEAEPLLYAFSPDSGELTALDWNRLTRDHATTLYGHWHGNDTTMRATKVRLVGNKATEGAKVGNVRSVRTDILSIDADTGSDDERLLAGRGFVLKDSFGEYTMWAIPLGIPVALLRGSADGNDVYARRGNELLRLTRNRDRPGEDSMFRIIVGCGGGIGQFSPSGTAHRPGLTGTPNGQFGVQIAPPASGDPVILAQNVSHRSAGDDIDIETAREQLEYPRPDGPGSPEDQPKIDNDRKAFQRRVREMYDEVAREQFDSQNAKPIPRIMNEEILWTIPSGATILDVLE